MEIIFDSRVPAGAALRETAMERVRFVMRRLTTLVPRAKVQLSDVNGPRGGIDKRCRVELRTDRGGTVVVSATAGDWRSALDEALARGVRVLTRSWQRSRARTRSRPRMDADAD